MGTLCGDLAKWRRRGGGGVRRRGGDRRGKLRKREVIEDELKGEKRRGVTRKHR